MSFIYTYILNANILEDINVITTPLLIRFFGSENRVFAGDISPFNQVLRKVVDHFSNFSKLKYYSNELSKIYWNSDLLQGNDFTECDSFISQSLVINSDTEGNTDFVSSGISFTNTLSTDVDLMADTSKLEVLDYQIIHITKYNYRASQQPFRILRCRQQ